MKNTELMHIVVWLVLFQWRCYLLLLFVRERNRRGNLMLSSWETRRPVACILVGWAAVCFLGRVGRVGWLPGGKERTAAGKENENAAPMDNIIIKANRQETRTCWSLSWAERGERTANRRKTMQSTRRGSSEMDTTMLTAFVALFRPHVAV